MLQVLLKGLKGQRVLQGLSELKVFKELKVEDHKDLLALRVTRVQAHKVHKEPQILVPQVFKEPKEPLVELVLKERKVPQELKDFLVHQRRLVSR